MNTINLTLKGMQKNFYPTVLVDDKPVKLVKNQFGGLNAKITTEKSSVNIKIQKYNELAGKLWFLMDIMFFIISLFGIFDVRKPKKCIVLDSEFNVNLTSDVTNLEFFVSPLNLDNKNVEIKGEAEINEVKNLCYEDKILKKRKKILFFTKLGLWVCLSVLIIFLVIKRF